LAASEHAPRQVVVGSRLERADVATLCAILSVLAERQPEGAIEVDVAALGRPDLATVDGLARLALAARRIGRSVRLVGAAPALSELLGFSGLTRVLPCRPDASVEVRW
jgi:ABC-type transporter Mla MlaB component